MKRGLGFRKDPMLQDRHVLEQMWDTESHVRGKNSHKVHQKGDAKKHTHNHRKVQLFTQFICGDSFISIPVIVKATQNVYHTNKHTSFDAKPDMRLPCELMAVEVSDNRKKTQKSVRMQLTRCLYQMLTRSNTSPLGFLCMRAFQNCDSSCLAHILTLDGITTRTHTHLIPDSNWRITYLSQLPNNRFGRFPHWQNQSSNGNYGGAMRRQTMAPFQL